jgi:BirA family biotin operon repressor/biotin-[acetyl-CoA-carboxylase] ligase
MNLIKSPYIKNYPTTNFFELTKSKVNKTKIIIELKSLYEEYINKFSKLNLKIEKNL